MPEQSPPGLPPEALERARDIGELLELIGSLWVSTSIHTAVELGVVDALAEGPKPSSAVAEAVGANPAALHRLLRALASLGLCAQDEAGRFALTPRGELLRADRRESFRSWVLLMGGRDSLRAWSELTECVKTGHTAAKLLDGLDDPFDAFADRPERREIFDRSMAEGTRQIAGAVALAYDFSGIHHLVDVGGGHGALLPPILRSHPEMTAAVFDLPACREGAERVFAKTRIADRCEFVAGSFFQDPLPEGADAYVLKSIIHDWDDERSVAILRTCRAAMREDARLLLLEMVVPERLADSGEHRSIAATDLNMLVSTGGLERTEAEYAALLAAAGLRIARIVPTLAGMSVIEARPR